MPTKKLRISWPCGICRSECINESIFCGCCKRWYHTDCENLTSSYLETLGKNRKKSNSSEIYTCLQCFKDEVGDNYDFCSSLTRLWMASRFGFETLRFAASREMTLMPPMEVTHVHNDLQGLQIDHYTEGALESTKIMEEGRVVKISGDGNCLFNAISVSVCGDEHMATELRVRTCIELCINDHYKYPNNSEIALLSGSYKKACIDAASDHSWTSMWGVIGAANAIGMTIKSIYPPLNGYRDLAFRRLNHTINPPKKRNDGVIKVVWTKIGDSRKPGTWCPNHFSAVISPEKESVNDFNEPDTMFAGDTFLVSEDNSDDISTKRPADHDVLPTLGPIDISSTEDPIDISSPCDTFNDISSGISNDEIVNYMSPEDNINSSSTEIETKFVEGLESQHNAKSTPNKCTEGSEFQKMGSHWLDVDRVYNLIKNSDEEDVQLDIPPGNKSNVFCLVDFTGNKSRVLQNKRCIFYDDCGVWDSNKGTTVNLHYNKEQNNDLKLVYYKNNLYCTRKQANKKKIFVPLDPQPSSDKIVVFHRSYSTLKHQPQLQRRTTYIVENNSPCNVAVVEYLGTYTNGQHPHGNSKNSNKYLRTHPETMEKISEKIKDGEKARKIYYEMLLENSMNGPSDFKQIRSKKYYEKRKQSEKKQLNIADDIVDGIAMVDSSEIVQEVLIAKKSSPAFILYTQDQILDLKYFLGNCSEAGEKLGIDRTFNLGPFFVTAFVYKNLRLIRKDNEQRNPLFLGPMLLHRSAKYQDYHAFLSHIKAELTSPITSVDIRIPSNINIGSDDEKALTNAIDSVFPSATRALCTKHMKDNVSYYLQNKIGIPVKERRQLLEKIFGETGLVAADDSFDFNKQADDILTATKNYPAFQKYYEKLKERILSYVIEPRKCETNSTKLWTNNNCESLNHILKLDFDWNPENTDGLIKKLNNVVKLQFLDFRRALYGNGNYRLIKQFQAKYYISVEKWKQMDEQEKQEIFHNFLKERKRKTDKKMVKSNIMPQLKVPCSPRVARKPGQKKRPRSERTHQRHN